MKEPGMNKPRGLASLADLADFDAILDVRSPSEFAEDHIPGAISCPVLDDAQRIEIGTLYKQASPFVAKKRGAAYVSANIARHLLEKFQDQDKPWRPLVMCWRGGQRSGAMTTVLRAIGWDACQLEGGYKGFRKQVLADLETLPRKHHFRVISGPTGSGKTRILQAIGAQGGQILDLETLACHKGSILGRVPGDTQPSQKSFETAIWHQLNTFDPRQPVFVEAESRKIGQLRLPASLYDAMQGSSFLRVEVPLAARIDFLLGDYDYFVHQPAELAERLDFLRPLRGNATVEAWLKLLHSGQFATLTESLLIKHYDILYGSSLARDLEGSLRAPTPISVPCLDPQHLAQAAQQMLALSE